ncbi:MAG: NlpC/P60 family protein [Weeksellaceae bacterium]
MKYGICTESVAPVRADASDRAEMVTQLLFGDKVEILKIEKKWLYVTTKYDNYAGWIDPKMITDISSEAFFQKDSIYFAGDIFNFIMEKTPMTIPIGASLPNYHHGIIQINDKSFEFNGEILKADENPISIVDLAQMYLNTPYLWGGKSTFGVDCSGMVQQVYKMKNIYLPRDTYQQAEYGEVLGFVEESEPGDLAFFDNEEGRIIHVGIILEGQKIIHAHGKVRIDPIDSTGIFNTDSQRYSHKLRFIKRVIK